jgi:uncharacterized damage-inducible protein DinB
MKTETFLRVLEARYKTTRKTIAAIPAEKLDFRPMPDMMSARDLALHLVGNYTFLHAGLSAGNWTTDTFTIPGEFPHTDAIVSKLDAVYRESAEKLPTLPDASFETRVSVFGREQKVGTLVQGIAEHEIQHRGQLQVYLRLMGVKPASG